MLPFYYAYYQSPIGVLRLKSTESGLYEAVFTDDKSENDLHQPPVLHECLCQLAEYFGGERKAFDLTINPAGTSFQCTVWDMLQQIGYGKTISYLKLAEQSGASKNTRAVANAIAKNPLAIIVPCHRVIGSNGNLTGYAWGLVRKKWLIDFEAKCSGQYMKLF